MKKKSRENTRQETTPPSPLPDCGNSSSPAMLLLRKALLHGQYDTIPNGMPDRGHVEETLLYVKQVQHYLAALAHGTVHASIPLNGYTGSLLKEMQDNLCRVLKLAATDPLTGIANRRHFFQEAARELERIRRTKTPACLAMLDIDHFKDLNDSLGHSAGDKALRHIVKIMTGIIRPYDIIGRYGGDEFVFLFPEISRDQAHALLERIRNAIEKAKIPAGEGNPCITVSIGLIELTVEKKITGNTLAHLIQRADDTLYAAKKQSRNHICIL